MSDLTTGPDFDGSTYQPTLDKDRLTTQLERVFDVLQDHRWHTLANIARQTGDPEASISARLRDMRKEKFGGMEVEHRRIGEGRSGLWEYRLLKDKPEPADPAAQQSLFAGMTYGDHRG